MFEQAVLDDFRLDNKVAVVTGASRSIGRATAVVFAEAGADVVVSGRWEEGIERVCREVEAHGRRALPVVCDVTQPAAVTELMRKTVDEFGGLDVLCANAGIFQEYKPSEDVTLADWDRVISTNLTGVAACCLAAGRVMIDRGGGSIVNVSSIAGRAGVTRTLSYTASKFGVVGLTKVLAVDWAQHGVRVNAVTPGFIERDEEPLLSDPAAVAFITGRTPMARWGKPRELALAILFLASPAASYITGTTLDVDGGWLAH